MRLGAFLILSILVYSWSVQGTQRIRNRGNPDGTAAQENAYRRPEVPGSKFRAEQTPNVDPNSEEYLKDDVSVGDCEEEDRDCMGVCFGTTVKDECGTCGGHNEACTGCDGVPNSGNVKDCYGVCGGTSRRDCEGICGGLAVRDSQGTCCTRTRVDDCGICYGNNACTDCNGDLDGDAIIDDCGVCAGGMSGKIVNAAKDCSGTCHGNARLDDCEVCSGGNSNHLRNGDMDCANVCFGSAVQDKCGVCDGDGTSCNGCDGVSNSGKVEDYCGVCGGDNSKCCGPYGACNNMGTCTLEEGGCLCDLGWTGKECTSKQDFCRWQSCGEHGTCNPENGRCVCEQGFMGDQCGYSRCSGHGTPDKGSGKCRCFEGYSGLDCSKCIGPADHKRNFVCLSKEGESTKARVVDEEKTRDAGGKVVLKSLRFTMLSTPRDTVESIIGGWDSLTRRPGIVAILPGSLYNGTTYGCNCQPAVPWEDVEHLFSKSALQRGEEEEQGEKEEEEDGKKKKRMDSQEITHLSAKAMLHLGEKLVISTRFVSHSYVRALTSIEASTFLNEIFDFFGVMEDALTGTPQTVGKAVDEVKEAAISEMRICIIYYTVMVTIVLVITIGSLILLFFFTGGRITRGVDNFGPPGGDMEIEDLYGGRRHSGRKWSRR